MLHDTADKAGKADAAGIAMLAQEAMSLLQDAYRRGDRLSSLAYASLLYVLDKAGAWEIAVHIYIQYPFEVSYLDCSAKLPGKHHSQSQGLIKCCLIALLLKLVSALADLGNPYRSPWKGSGPDIRLQLSWHVTEQAHTHQAFTLDIAFQHPSIAHAGSPGSSADLSADSNPPVLRPVLPGLPLLAGPQAADPGQLQPGL